MCNVDDRCEKSRLSVPKRAAKRQSPHINQVCEPLCMLPTQQVNSPENLSLKHQVVLDKVVQCPGCSVFFGNQQKCAQHLLVECLSPKHLVKKKCSHRILRYFYDHFAKSKLNEKSKSPGNHQKSAKRKRFQINNVTVNVPVIPCDLLCPICDKYFYPAEVCYTHIFEHCLCTKKLENASLVGNWFLEYLRSNCQSKLNHLTLYNQFQNAERRVVCNYCRQEFLEKESMLNHFRLVHKQETNARDPVCTFCHFKPGSYNQLFRHLIRGHVKCGCLEKQKDFITLKMHLSVCPKRDDCVCPVCQEVKVYSYITEEDFKTHIFNCRRPAPLKLNLHDLYIQCDICFQEILTCNLDIHIAKHIEFFKTAKRERRRTVVKFNNNLPKSDSRIKK